MRTFSLILLLELVIAGPLFAEQQKGLVTASCTFSDSKQILVRYHNPTAGNKKRQPPFGKVWAPGGSAMTLFTQSALAVDNSLIPIGAYSLYVIPEAKNWTLVVNKNVTTDQNYDQRQDLLRVPMPTGTLGHPVEKLKVYFGHVAPKQCNMRIYFGKIGAWTEFKER